MNVFVLFLVFLPANGSELRESAGISNAQVQAFRIRTYPPIAAVQMREQRDYVLRSASDGAKSVTGT